MQSTFRPAQRLAFILLVLAMPVFAARPVAAQDASELLVRVNRLETQVRQLQGSIEELQFQNRKLEDQLRKFQEDVEYRFQERSGGSKPPAAAAPAAPGQPGTAQKPQKKSDAFDPQAQPDAPGAPRSLGSTAELPRGAIPGAADQTGRIIEDGDGPIVLDPAPGEGPLDLSRMNRNAVPVAPLSPSAAIVPPRQAPAQGSQVAVAGTGNPRDQYDLAYGLVLQRQYEQAEMAFRQFLQTNPRDKLVPNATYWLGETYFRRNRYPDAVEQYLKIYKTFGTSKVAPDSMLRLALSLRGMGQPDQACATLAEIGRKYPDATTEVRSSVEREQKRGNC
jgi:tol-pal system protein YbgF